MKNLLLIIGAAFLCVSCDIFVPHILNIDNRTNDTIRIRFSEESSYSKIFADSLVFLPQSKKLLYGVEGYQIRNGCDYTGIFKDQVKVELSSGKILTKDISDVANWNCSGSFRVGWEQTFVIEEEDLE